MRVTFFAILAFALVCASRAASPVKLSDEQLRAQIVGVWFREELPEVTKHIGGRTQYFPDGRMIGDYHISSPGSERFIRSVGTWKINGGVFSETVERTSDPEVTFPTFVRRVLAIDHHHMLLGATDGGPARAEMWRGKGPLETGARSVSSLDRKRFLADLASIHINGFRAVPAGNGMSSFQLDSRKIDEARHH